MMYSSVARSIMPKARCKLILRQPFSWACLSEASCCSCDCALHSSSCCWAVSNPGASA